MARNKSMGLVGALALTLVLWGHPAGGTPQGPAAFDWNSIPLDVENAKTLGPPETRQPVVRSLAQVRPLKPCTSRWVAPPGAKDVRVRAELRLVSEKDVVTVVDAVVLESNPADASLNRCYVEKLRGTRHPAPGMEPGRHFRIEWPSILNLK